MADDLSYISRMSPNNRVNMIGQNRTRVNCVEPFMNSASKTFQHCQRLATVDFNRFEIKYTISRRLPFWANRPRCHAPPCTNFGCRPKTEQLPDGNVI